MVECNIYSGTVLKCNFKHMLESESIYNTFYFSLQYISEGNICEFRVFFIQTRSQFISPNIVQTHRTLFQVLVEITTFPNTPNVSGFGGNA